MEGWSFYSLPHKLTLSLGALQSVLSPIQKPAKSLKKWPLSWNRLYLIWPSTLNMALTSKMTNLHTGANLSMLLYSKSTLVRMFILREKGGVHWEGGSAHVRERLRQEVVIKALHQVAPGSIHFPHLCLHQVLSNHLAPRIPHLMDSSEDFNARNEAFWFRGGIGPDKSMIKKREGRRNFEEKEFRDKVTQFLQQISPTLTILGCNRANVACRGSKKDWH